MWDRLFVDCHAATMVRAPGNPLGLLPNAAIGVQDGRIVRVGKRTELAGFRAAEVVPLGGAWVTPGLIDCHTHLIFGGTRAQEHAMRRAGASYEDIARAGGGIASTVAATAASGATDLLAAARRRLRALMPAAARRSRSSRATVSIRPARSACSTSPARLASPKTCGSSRPSLRFMRCPPNTPTAARNMSTSSSTS